MKLTSLTIAPKRTYSPISENNPMRAVVKLESEDSAIECVLSEASILKMLDLCAQEITDQAKERVNEFAAAVAAIDNHKSTVLIGSE